MISLNKMQIVSWSTAIVLIGSGVMLALAQPARGQGRPEGAQSGKIREPASPQGDYCRLLITVQSVDGTVQHLKVGQRLRLIGPDGPAGDYWVHPIGNAVVPPPPPAPPHNWLFKDYKAINVTVGGDPKFQLFVDVQGGPHPLVNVHTYEMTFTEVDEDGCPTEVTFDTGEHGDPSTGGDHGGHAVVS